MTEGGARIGAIKSQLMQAVKAGVTPLEIDKLCEELILKGGDRPNFKMVPDYYHSTCINTNAGIVHGIPNKVPFKPGDVVKVDMGLYHDGFHLDTAFTMQVPPLDNSTTEFLKVGERALKNAIAVAFPGNSIYDISVAIQDTVESAGYKAIRDLTGHGVGKELHMEPYIPCFADRSSKKHIIHPNQTLAIEVMYAKGDYHLVEDPDGWTLSTQDGSITGMFEESVYISEEGPIILTKAR